MMSEILELYETRKVLDSGQMARIVYDKETDILEIVFEGVAATCAVELTDNILLRFNLETERAAGLTILDYSILVTPSEIGPRNFPMIGLDDLPEAMRQMVVKIIISPPVNQILKVSALYSTSLQPLPITYVERPAVLAKVA